jgi:hypothetical protein
MHDDDESGQDADVGQVGDQLDGEDAGEDRGRDARDPRHPLRCAVMVGG